MTAYNYTGKIKGHIHFEKPKREENVIVVAQENYNSVAPENSLLNLEEIIGHVPRGSAKVIKKMPCADENFGQTEGKNIQF